MTKKKEMRIKEVGATINLGNYSTLHVTVGESAEYEGLELQRATSYLRNLAEKVGGILNLPDEMVDAKKAKTARTLSTPMGAKDYAFGDMTPIFYEHINHAYSTEDGKPLTSVTQYLSKFYPMNESIAKEYLDFAASFGNLVHTAIQNAVIGKAPKKKLIKEIVENVLKKMGTFDESWVEKFIVSVDDGLAGRFDILTQKDEQNTLWDVKTNSDLFMAVECKLPETAKQYLLDYWDPNTMFGEHCLQLNFYAYMLEKTGTPIEDIRIIHVPDEFEQIYPVPKIDMVKFMELLKDNG